jgi:hypothetical protein
MENFCCTNVDALYAHFDELYLFRDVQAEKNGNSK